MSLWRFSHLAACGRCDIDLHRYDVDMSAADAPSRLTATPAERVLRARMAAYTLHSRVDGRAHTAAARRGFLARFEAEVDPDGTLPPEVRKERAQRAMKAHMLKLAAKSARSRRQRS